MTKKNYFKPLILIFFLGLISNQLTAQISDENTFIINKYFQSTSNSISSEQVLTKSIQEDINKVRTSFINNAELNILQSGNYNYVNINTQGSKFDVTQQGNNNSYEFLTYYGREDLNIEIQQVGNDNSIQIYGENSILDNMKIVQRSNSKTIIINNF